MADQISDIRRMSQISFCYRDVGDLSNGIIGKEVIGWVDEISKDYIKVGNEAYYGSREIENTKKYEILKISNVSILTDSNDPFRPKDDSSK